MAQLNPSWTSSRLRTTDEIGHFVDSESTVVTQRYRLTLDRTLFPLVVLGAGGNLEWTNGWSVTDRRWTELEARRWNGYGRMRMGGPFLNGALDYGYRRDEAESRAGGVTASAPDLVRQSAAASVAWHPEDLPALDLRAARSTTRDSPRQGIDQTSDEAVLGLRYEPSERLDLRYTGRYATVLDALNDVRASELTNTLFSSWNDTFLAGRVSAYANYTVTTRHAEVTARGPGGVVETQQLPAPGGGLSKVEVFPDTPDRVTLSPNPELVDGNVTSPAGLNLGFAAGAGAVVQPRDLGAAFPNVVTNVNAIYVYVDEQLPLDLAATFSWDAYRSDDNVTWTLVAAGAPATFDSILNRFEIPIPQTAARYLKVVTRPLDDAVTADPRFAEIFVTELQFFLVVPASEARGRSFSLGGNASGTLKAVLLRDPNLVYDLSVFLNHTDAPVTVAYSITNGLSILKRLARSVSVSGRVERTDSDAGEAHEGVNRWSATVAWDPLPTLGGGANYTGQVLQREEGIAVSNSGALFAHADLYQGLSTNAALGFGVAEDVEGVRTESASANASVSIVPNRIVSLALTGSYSRSEQSGGGKPARSDDRALVEASLSLSPFPTLALAASVIEFFEHGRSSTAGSFSAAYSPFQGGDLQLRYNYSETLDTALESRNRSHGPGARWNIRSGWYLDGAASWSRTTTPAQTADSAALFANLLITFR